MALGAFNEFALNGAAINGGEGGKSYYLALDAGSVALAGSSASLLRGKKVFADAGAVALTVGSATLLRTACGRLFSVEPSAYSVSFDDAGFIRNYRITLERGQFASYGEVAELFTGIFAIVLERTFKVKFEARQFSAENITSSLPVKDENRVFVVPKSSRTFAASSTGGDI